MRLPALLLLAITTGALGACDLVERPPLERDFGAHYVILEDQPADVGSGLVQSTPHLDDEGLLVVVVRYEGGCTPHHFRAEQELTPEAATIWLVHADNGETCGGEKTETLTIQLSPEVLARPRIVLLGPSGGEALIRDEAISVPQSP